MRVEKTEIESGPEVVGPFTNKGRLVITQEDDGSHNLFAQFVESVWMVLGDETYNVGFTPEIDKATLWVSGESKAVVNKVLDEAAAMLRTGFGKAGLSLEIKEGDFSKT